MHARWMPSGNTSDSMSLRSSGCSANGKRNRRRPTASGGTRPAVLPIPSIPAASMFSTAATSSMAGKQGTSTLTSRYASARIHSEAEPDGSILSRMVDSPKGKGYGLHIDHGKIHVNLTGVYESDAIRLESEDKKLEANRWYHLAADL